MYIDIYHNFSLLKMRRFLLIKLYLLYKEASIYKEGFKQTYSRALSHANDRTRFSIFKNRKKTYFIVLVIPQKYAKILISMRTNVN